MYKVTGQNNSDTMRTNLMKLIHHTTKPYCISNYDQAGTNNIPTCQRYINVNYPDQMLSHIKASVMHIILYYIVYPSMNMNIV